MKKNIYSICVSILIAVLLTGCGSTDRSVTDNQPPPIQGSAAAKDVTKTYTGIYVKSWDENINPVLFALVQNSIEWNALFGNTDIGSGPPSANIYDTDEFLVVSRLVPIVSGMNIDNVFQVESVDGGNDLVLKYRYVQPSGSSTWSGTLYFLLQFAKQPYQRVIIVENGNQIGILNVAKRQWSVPAL